MMVPVLLLNCIDEDEEMEEEEEEELDGIVVTRDMVHQWRIQISKHHSTKVIKKLISALKSFELFNQNEENAGPLEKYRVVDEKGILRLH
jgi:hypothetical protein